jgi:hypothetical protein
MTKQNWVIAPFDYEAPEIWQSVWENNLREGFISIGWRKLRNVSTLSIVDIAERHRRKFPDAKKRTAGFDANVLFKFWNKVKVGDTIIARRGRKAIAAMGRVMSNPYYDSKKAAEHFYPDLAYPNHIDVRWADRPRDLQFAKQVFGMQTLHTISDEKLRQLTKTKMGSELALFPDEVDSGRTYDEGAVKVISVNAYERNAAARAECLRTQGYRCKACDMSFAETYGELGLNFIHVHHVNPFSTRQKKKTDPANDLVPVCPNCHAMLHRSEKPLTIEQLKHLLDR